MNRSDRIKALERQVAELHEEIRRERGDHESDDRRWASMSEAEREDFYEGLQQWIDAKELNKDFQFKEGTVTARPDRMDLHRKAKTLLQDQKASDYAEAVKIILKTMR